MRNGVFICEIIAHPVFRVDVGQARFMSPLMVVYGSEAEVLPNPMTRACGLGKSFIVDVTVRHVEDIFAYSQILLNRRSRIG